MKLSKSRFVAGCQCLRRLYWQVHAPELAERRDDAAEAIIQQGQEVGMLARTLFPGGVEVDCSRGLADAIRTTRELVASPEVRAIFEAMFEYHNVLVKVDILHRRREPYSARHHVRRPPPLCPIVKYAFRITRSTQS
jgi:hypothetical protein